MGRYTRDCRKAMIDPLSARSRRVQVFEVTVTLSVTPCLENGDPMCVGLLLCRLLTTTRFPLTWILGEHQRNLQSHTLFVSRLISIPSASFPFLSG